MPSDRHHILVVDDDVHIRESLAELFRDEGYTVDSAANGAEALRKMRERRPSFVILDLMMPVMTGWEAYAEMKADPELATIPVCILSAAVKDIPDDAACVLQKPIKMETLLDAVDKHVHA